MNKKINKKIIEYYSNINTKFDNLKDKPKFSYSQIQERIARLGIEVKAFEVNIEDMETLEFIALSTLRKDFFKQISSKED